MRWPLLLLLTSCGSSSTTADAPASRNAECQTRLKDAAATTNDLTFRLDNTELPRRSPEVFRAGTQEANLRQERFSSDVLRGQTPRGGASMTIDWLTGWTPPNLSGRELHVSQNREYLACDQQTGNQEPGVALARRFDDENGNLLFFRASTGVTLGSFTLPAAVPRPDGVSFGWEPDSDPCAHGTAALLLQTPAGEYRLRADESREIVIGGVAFVAMVSLAQQPPATGNFCGEVAFVLFKKGLFVPPAN